MGDNQFSLNEVYEFEGQLATLESALTRVAGRLQILNDLPQGLDANLDGAALSWLTSATAGFRLLVEGFENIADTVLGHNRFLPASETLLTLYQDEELKLPGQVSGEQLATWHNIEMLLDIHRVQQILGKLGSSPLFPIVAGPGASAKPESNSASIPIEHQIVDGLSRDVRFGHLAVLLLEMQQKVTSDFAAKFFRESADDPEQQQLRESAARSIAHNGTLSVYLQAFKHHVYGVDTGGTEKLDLVSLEDKRGVAEVFIVTEYSAAEWDILIAGLVQWGTRQGLSLEQLAIDLRSFLKATEGGATHLDWIRLRGPVCVPLSPANSFEYAKWVLLTALEEFVLVKDAARHFFPTANLICDDLVERFLVRAAQICERHLDEESFGPLLLGEYHFASYTFGYDSESGLVQYYRHSKNDVSSRPIDVDCSESVWEQLIVNSFNHAIGSALDFATFNIFPEEIALEMQHRLEPMVDKFVEGAEQMTSRPGGFGAFDPGNNIVPQTSINQLPTLGLGANRGPGFSL